MKRRVVPGILLAVVLSVVSNAGIIGSKHDLSVSNYYGPSADASLEVCVFCHTPHSASAVINAPIWNRKITEDVSTVFTMYGGTVGTPGSVSLACLSCHDGVSSQGVVSAVNPYDTHNLLNLPNTDTGSPNCNACHPDGGEFPSTIWQIGPNLANDHPISMSYSNAYANDTTGFKAVPDPGIKLFNDQVECATCHDVHDPSNGTFLRINNAESALCLSCHIR